MCNYRVKKEITLKKHINTKHRKNNIPEGMASKEVSFLTSVMNVDMLATVRNH